MAMSRFSPVGNARRLARSLLPRQNTSCLEIKNSGTEFAVGLPSFLCRLYSQYKLSNKGLTCLHNWRASLDATNMGRGRTVPNRQYFIHACTRRAHFLDFICVFTCRRFNIVSQSHIFSNLFSPCIAIAPFADHLGTEFRKKWLHIVHFTLEKAGPAFIKWGKWAATRPDLFPKDLYTELAKLQTKAPAHSYAYYRMDRVTLLEFFKSVALRDGRAAAECTLKLSKQQNCPNPDAFIKEVEQIFGYWGSTEGDFIHPAECMQQMLEQVRRHRVNIDGNVCTVMVIMLVLEGWQRKLDPEYDVMHTLQTLLFKSERAESLYYIIEGLKAP